MAAFSYLWRCGSLPVSDPQVGQTITSSFDAEWAYCGWTPRKDTELEVATSVESVSDHIVTPAGEFLNCLKLTHHIRPKEYEFASDYMGRTLCGTTYTWFAPGIGLVKLIHLDQMYSHRMVYLTASSVCDGNGYFPIVSGAWWEYRWLGWRGLFEDRCCCLGEVDGSPCFSSGVVAVDASAKMKREYWLGILDCERQGDDDVGYAQALRQVGVREKDPNQRQALYEEAMTLKERTGDDRHVPGSQMPEVGVPSWERKEMPSSPEGWVRWAQEDLEWARERGHRLFEVQALDRLAFAYYRTGEYEAAAAHFEEAAGIYRELGGVRMSAHSEVLAELLRRRNKASDRQGGPAYSGSALGLIQTEDGWSFRGGWGVPLRDPPSWPSEASGSPMHHFVFHAFDHALRVLHREVGERGPDSRGWIRTTATLISEDERVTVPAGAFEHCRLTEAVVAVSGATDLMKPVRMQRDWHAGTVRHWFAPGVGCVRTRYEHRNGLVTDIELVSYELSEPSEEYLPMALGNCWVYRWTDPADGTRLEDTVFVALHRDREWWLGFDTAWNMTHSKDVQAAQDLISRFHQAGTDQNIRAVLSCFGPEAMGSTRGRTESMHISPRR